MDKKHHRFWNDTIRHFDYTEFSAPEDPESGLLMNHFLIMALDDFRERLGYGVHINPNGGFSLKGHSDGSFHYQGEAADFHVDPACPLSPRQVMRELLALGKFGGVGFYPEWKPVPGFHSDVRLRFQLWVKRGGEYIFIFQ